mmetsp:Transcript_7347/g.13599  ORF Transcript_7347/g.13599 Transcript_7347/m.13599 type:complete len:80 (+) Transcript_7347:115-354(+)
MSACTAAEEGKTCGAVDKEGRCKKAGRVRMSGGLAERARLTKLQAALEKNLRLSSEPSPFACSAPTTPSTFYLECTNLA